ncbi:hypothetical protein AAE478_000283 [Parahypoxylon ruwenzoriense]
MQRSNKKLLQEVRGNIKSIESIDEELPAAAYQCSRSLDVFVLVPGEPGQGWTLNPQISRTSYRHVDVWTTGTPRSPWSNSDHIEVDVQTAKCADVTLSPTSLSVRRC